MKIIAAVVIFVLITDLITWAMCKAAAKGDKEIENPGLINLRGKK